MSGNVWMFSDEIDDEDLEFMSHDYVTYNMACEYYRLGIKPVVRMAHEAGAVYKIGKFQFYGMFCIRIIVFILILHIRHLNGVVNHQHKQRFIVLLLVLRNLIEMKKDCFQQKRRARFWYFDCDCFCNCFLSVSVFITENFIPIFFRWFQANYTVSF